jgi:hypothetical protein
MIKTIIISVSLFVAALTMPAISSAQYGQEVLGEKAPEVIIVHKPVEAGIEDHPELVGALLLVASFGLKYISRKTKVEYSS